MLSGRCRDGRHEGRSSSPAAVAGRHRRWPLRSDQARVQPPSCLGIGLIPVELTNIHNWRFGRSFARPIPGSDLASKAPAVRVLCWQSGIRVARSCPWRIACTHQRAMPGCVSCRRRTEHRHRLCHGCARRAAAGQRRRRRPRCASAWLTPGQARMAVPVLKRHLRWPPVTRRSRPACREDGTRRLSRAAWRERDELGKARSFSFSSGDASRARAGSAAGNWSQAGRDSSQTQWGSQPETTRPGQASPGMLKGPRSRAAAAQPSASRRTVLPFLPDRWAPRRPPCRGRTPAARSRWQPR